MMTPFIAEIIGTALLLLLGGGAWGFSVFVGAYVTGQFSGGHLNPAVTLGLAVIGKFSWSLVPLYIVAQVIGAMLGSWLNYLLYIDHYRITEDEDTIRGTFCTAPAIRSFKNNFFSEALGTFILVFGIFFIVSPSIVIDGVTTENFGIGSLDALPVALLVWVIGMSLGGTTGYAINPARDFGPRLVYQLIPRKNKKADWGYSWIPILGPLTGAFIAGVLYNVLMA
jgi:glycerol uptake facilitator protein